jgi:Outer membrane protein beta-barrel domain
MQKFNLIYLLLFCVCLTGSLKAQKLQWGLKAGWNASAISFHSDVEGIDISAFNKNRDWLGHYFGGLSFRYPIGSKLHLSAEPNYNLKGYDGIRQIGTVTSEFSTRYHYVNLPVLIDYQFGQHFFVEAGAEYGYMLLRTLGEPGKLERLKFQRSPVINSEDFGIIIGAGYALNQRLKLNVRYIRGMAGVSKSGYRNPAGTSIPDAIENRNLSAQAGLTFFFNK